MGKPVLLDLPAWLLDPRLPEPDLPEHHLEQLRKINEEENRNYPAMVELAEQIYLGFFERVIIDLSNGINLKSIVKTDPRGIDPGKFRAWIHRDKERLRRYKEARAIGASAIEDEMIEIADAAHNPLEDVSRSKLKIDTRKDLLKVWDRDTYGDHKRVEVSSTQPVDIDHLENLRNNLRNMMKKSVIEYTNDEVEDAIPTPSNPPPPFNPFR